MRPPRHRPDLPSLLLASAVAVACTAVLVLGFGPRSTLVLDTIPAAEWGVDTGAGGMTATELREAAFSRMKGLLLALSAVATGVALVTALTLEVARGSRARTPIAIRAALGASPGTLRRNLLRSRVRLLLVRGAAGGAVAALALALALVLAWPEGSTTPDAAARWMAVALVVGFASAGVAAALLPLRYGREPLTGVLAAGRAQDDPFEGGLRRVLAVLQVALALGVLVGGVGALRTVASSGPDVPAADVVANAGAPAEAAPAATMLATVALDEGTPPGARARAHNQLLERARDLPTLVSESIATPGAWSGVGRTGYVMTECGNCIVGLMLLPMRGEVAQQHVVSSGFFGQAGLQVLAGRTFTARDVAGAPLVAVVSRSFAARNFEDGDPLGRRIRLQRSGREVWLDVVGVVDEPTGTALGRPEGRAPAVYLPVFQHPPDRVVLAVTAPGATAVDVEAIVRAAGLDVEGSETLAERRQRERAPLAWVARIAAGIGLVALLAALAGARATARTEVEARRRSLGIRAALGADRRRLLTWVLGRSFRAAALGVLLALPLAVGVGGVLRTLASGLPLLDLVTFGTLAVLLTGAALAGALGPARDAAATDPARVLAGE